MPTYVLRAIPPDLIARAKQRARDDSTTLDAVLIRYLQTYAEHRLPQAAGGRARHEKLTTYERSAAGRRAARWHGKLTAIARASLKRG